MSESEDLQTKLALIGAHIDDVKITERRNLGEINFASSRESFRAVCKNAAELATMPLDLLSTDAFREIRIGTDDIERSLLEMESFSIADAGDSTLERNDIARRFEDEAQRFFSMYEKHIPYLNYRRSGQATAEAAEKLIESTDQRFASKYQELEQIVSAARTAAPGAPIQKFASYFSDLADRWEEETKQWRKATILTYSVGFSLLGALLGYTLLNVSDGADAAEQLYLLAIKLPVVGMILTCVFWCSRHYSVAKQQAVINRHRAHAISTFSAFAEATEDPVVKDAVLTTAVECVFVHVPTGLTRQGGSQPQNQVLVDIGRALNRTAAGGRQSRMCDKS